MKVNEIILYKVQMKMRNPFTTSFGTEQDRLFLLVEAKNEEGISGWGECVTSERPLYSEEFTQSSWHMLEEFLIPMVLKKEIQHPDELQEKFNMYKRNNMAKSTLEAAIWDLYAKSKGEPLSKALGGVKSTVEVGISLGIEDNVDDLLKSIQQKTDEGYRRIKVKIKPGKDINVLQQIRNNFPDIPLMADANSAYTLKDIDTLKAMDQFNLMMIEQPLTAGDLIDHAKLQKQIKTPICLDESIHSYEDARQAIELGSCKIINMKVGRVGGLTQAKKIHDLCEKENIPLWCGGMLESGIGRAHNMAITTLSNFKLPGDTASSSRYWDKDIIEPEVVVENGQLHVPDRPGIGFDVNREEIKKNTIEMKVFR
ncbi:o-succinylbenzoate synthase [Virgibacillus dakarensis]|uniref:o-succinylbenzoate synthase n=1 Tax=Lentibacillus populi TaxID=1827502 RepID=A0A9W5X5L7_9BACI|nr:MULTISPECIES: o-succinylbenzoate synthase [Bacillaceae]MBT2216328.1 o-succinylbenzoate synthase [Virgibacillus dakarensis]MTW85184.1 o-succinylbenzoate synthase [Virgibacillus dakarensis]GGB43686.1 o-succinylbenzoate synthase [Lentibacillus populi]